MPVALTLLLALAAPLEPVTSTPLTQPYAPRGETVLVRDGAPQAVVAVPEAAPYAALADAVAERLQRALGVALPRVPEAEAPRDGRAVVVLGNAFTGPLARRLYANRLVCADGLLPASGYELRSVPDALDLGADVVFLGGASPEAVLAAADALAAKLKPGPNISLPYSIDAPGLRGLVSASPDEAAIGAAVAELERQLAAFRSNKLENAISRLAGAARGFLLTGDEAFGRLYAALLKPTLAYWNAARRDPPTFALADFVCSLDQVEESAGLTPEDRLLAAEWLRSMTESTMAFWEMRGPARRYQAGQVAPPWNHETHPALAIAHSSQYLRSHYAVAAADWWDAVVDHTFAGQLDLDQPLEDSANYQWLVHRHTIGYVLATGRHSEFLTGDALRRHLDYAIASHNARGDEATHGDAWQAFGSIAGPSFALGLAATGRPEYAFMLERLGAADRPVLWTWNTPPTPSQMPPDHTGLRVFTVDPRRAEAYGIEPATLDGQPALDKAVLRSGWQPSDEYLMLDGLNVGNHKHIDANAIITYERNRRRWLVDMDYIRAAPRHHNTVVVTRDGLAPDTRPASHGNAQVIAAQPFAASLDAAASGPGMALVQSTLRDYGGLDWTRSLFWAEDQHLLVVDELVARQAGRYVTRCTWRTLGEVSVEGSIIHVRQRGQSGTRNEQMAIIDDAERKVVELLRADTELRLERELAAGEWKLGVVARGRDGGSDSLFVQLDDAERQAAHLPTEGNPDAPAPLALPVAQAGPHRLTLSLREGPGVRVDALLLTGPDGKTERIEAEALAAAELAGREEPEQHFYIVNGDGAAISVSDQFDYGHGGADGYFAPYPFAEPVTRVITQVHDQRLEAGQRITYVNLLHTAEGDAAEPRALAWQGERSWVVTGGEPMLATLGGEPGGHDWTRGPAALVTTRGRLAAGAEAALLPDADVASLRDLVRRGTAAPDAVTGHPLTVAGFEVSRVISRPADVTALAAGGGQFVTGDAAGHVAAFAPDGKAVWDTDLGSPVRTLARVGDGWAAGTVAGDVVRLDADGQVQWTYRCERFHGRTGSVGTVFAADVDGDGAPEVVAGSDNHHYHALGAGGKLLWRTETVHASTVGCAANLDGDAAQEVVAGTEYYWPRVLDHDGKQMRSYSGGPVTSAVAAMDVDGDGVHEGLIGMEDAYVRAVKPAGGWLWEANVGGTPTAVVPLPGNRLAVASDGFGVAFLDGAGQRTGYTHLPQAARDAAQVGRRLVVPCDDGSVYLLTPDGEVAGACALPARPTRVVALDDQHAAVACGPFVAVVPVR